MLPGSIYATVASLPAASGQLGNVALVLDSTVSEAVGSGAVVVGGGTTRARVKSDGTNWRIHGSIGKGVGGALVGTTYNFLSSLDAASTLTRASTAWSWDVTPALISNGNNVARFTFDPLGSGLLGLLNEVSAINGVVNSSAVGAVAASPGTPPTNWTFSGSPQDGMTRTIVGIGTEDGIPYIDVRYAGTTSAQSNAINFQPLPSGLCAAVQGESWVISAFVRLVAGSLAGLNGQMFFQMIEFNAGGSSVGSQTKGFTPTSAALKTQRITDLRVFNQVTAAFLGFQIRVPYLNAQAVDFTLRIGNPQATKATTAAQLGSPIITTNAGAVTRAADVLTLNIPARTYPQIDIGRVISGTTTLTNVVVGGGGYVVPGDANALRFVTVYT